MTLDLASKEHRIEVATAGEINQREVSLHRQMHTHDVML